MQRKAPLAILIGCALTFVACGDDDDDPEDATADLCADRTELVTAVQGFRALDLATTTVDQAREAASEISDALDSLRDNRGDLAEAQFEELEDAWIALDNEIEDLSGDETLPQADAAISEEVAVVDAAQAAFFEAAGCGAPDVGLTTTTAG